MEDPLAHNLGELERLYQQTLETRDPGAVEVTELYLRQLGELLEPDDLDRAFELARRIRTLRDLTPH